MFNCFIQYVPYQHFYNTHQSESDALQMTTMLGEGGLGVWFGWLFAWQKVGKA